MSLYPLLHARRIILVGLMTAAGLVSAASLELTSSKQAKVQPQTDQPSVTARIPGRLPGGNSPAITKLPVNGIRPQGAIGRSNPLWAIPLATLSATRERPIFSPTRRRPQIAGAPPIQAIVSSSTRPSRPLLALVGAIAAEHESIAIFLDETTKRIIRLKTGESHAGWTLRIVQGREATLQKDHETAVVALSLPPLIQRP